MRSSSRRLNRRSPLRRAAVSPTRHCDRRERLFDELVRGSSPPEHVVVAQVGDELGLTTERVAEEAARSEDAARSFGGAGSLAERRGEVAGSGRPFGEPAELQEREVGVGRLRAPLEQDRQQLAHQARGAGQTPGQLANAARVAARSRKPNARSRSSAASSVERSRTTGERVEQRTEEQLLVDRPHLRLVAPVVGLELLDARTRRAVPGSRGHARGASRAASSVGSVWVCCSSQSCSRCSTVRRKRYASESGGAVANVDVAGAHELRRALRASCAERMLGSWRPCTSWRSWTANSMSRIPPRPRLSSRSARPRDGSPPRLRAFITRTSRTASGGEHLGPDERLRHAPTKLGPSVAVAGDGSRLEQRLELPGLRPPLPVRGVAVDRPRERAGAALGSEVGIGAEHDPVGSRFGHHLEQRARTTRSASAVGALVDEEHVDVGRVVQLATRRACPSRSPRSAPSAPRSRARRRGRPRRARRARARRSGGRRDRGDRAPAIRRSSRRFQRRSAPGSATPSDASSARYSSTSRSRARRRLRPRGVRPTSRRGRARW